MVQLGANRFLDALPQGDAQGLGSLPAHNILKVTLTHDSLALVLPSDDWLCKETRMKLGECINQDFLLTARPIFCRASCKSTGRILIYFLNPAKMIACTE